MGLTMIIPTKVQTLLDFKMTIINMLTSLTTMGTLLPFDLQLINFTIKKVQMPTTLFQEKKGTMSSINSKKLS